MSALIDELRRLQTIEVQLAELRRNRESKERRVETKRRQVQKIDERLDAAHRSARERQMRLDALQLEMMAREDSIGKHRQALNKAKTNKEYAAVLTAMNTEKADNTKLEASVLDVMKELDAGNAELQTIEAEKAKLVEDVRKADAELSAFDRSCAAERTSLEEQRKQHAANIPPQAMDAFSRAAQRHEGEAMAAVAKPRPKVDEYMCTGCNMKVTLDVVNALATRDDVRICGSCNRILYLEPTPAKR